MGARLFGVDLLEDAAAELEHETTYYERRGGLALRNTFLDEFARIARRIVERPRLFPLWPGKPGVRKALLKRFPFAIAFVAGGGANDEPPLIIAIAHTKRRPGYWLARAGLGRRRGKRTQ